MEPRSAGALSSSANSAVEGGASPLPASTTLHFSDEWTYEYFIVVPMLAIKQYNHEPVGRIMHHHILNNLGDFDRNSFPPIMESWGNPFSMCVKVTCTKKVFEKIRAEITDVYTDFGGRPEMMLYYQTSGALS